MKGFLYRFANGFCYGVAISLVVQLVIIVLTDSSMMLPEYMEGFDNILVAYGVQLLLIGFISGVASGGVVILEWKRLGLVIQSIIYLLVMFSTWVPVACYLWGAHKYVSSMIAGVFSILVTYGICWGIQYKICRRDVKEINEMLKERMASDNI